MVRLQPASVFEAFGERGGLLFTDNARIAFFPPQREGILRILQLCHSDAAPIKMSLHGPGELQSNVSLLISCFDNAFYR